MFRHGDVLIQRLRSRKLKGARRLPHLILAHGEVTGHTHRVQPESAAELYESDGELVLCVRSEATVVHEEHKPITLPPGTYRVWRQREYTPEEIRTIRD